MRVALSIALVPTALAAVKFSSFPCREPRCVDFGKTDLPKLYAEFGTEIEFEMIPFVYGSVDSDPFDATPGCWEGLGGPGPDNCTEEQTAFCVIDIAQKSDPDSAQDKIVQWEICNAQGMVALTVPPFTCSNGNLEQCHAKVGIDSADVDACLSDTSRSHALMQTYIVLSRGTDADPPCYAWAEVNGKNVGNCNRRVPEVPTYANVKKAICAADSTLSACTSVLV